MMILEIANYLSFLPDFLSRNWICGLSALKDPFPVPYNTEDVYEYPKALPCFL